MQQEGYRQLIINIILQAKSDLEVGKEKSQLAFIQRQDAIRFVSSEWFEELFLEIGVGTP